MWLYCCLFTLTLAHSETYRCGEFGQLTYDKSWDQDLKLAFQQKCGVQNATDLKYSIKWECELLRYGREDWKQSSKVESAYYNGAYKTEAGKNAYGQIVKLKSNWDPDLCNAAKKYTEYACKHFQANWYWWDAGFKFGCVFWSGGPETYVKRK
ncbi:unnamed protein product [Cylicocyclus nassatus]|uniref:Uncharacterized protein n=1 Tax=Cylicocyclus nassatus TaxID=53992 RepID=A0AA36DSW7_CYLNA|nr:unnamed protein product [Cylicocyclus nassatus]